MKVTRKQGFTLIELLVVIVIIGILAGALFGPITGALASARRSGMAQTGRQIVQAIITADSQGAFRGYAWPSDEAGRYSGTKPSNGPNMYQAFSTTEAYFTEALYMAQTNAQDREKKKVLKEIEPSDLVADGYVEATGTTINEENCAWIIAKNVRQAPGNTPVLISRNFNCTNLINTAGDDVLHAVDDQRALRPGWLRRGLQGRLLQGLRWRLRHHARPGLRLGFRQALRHQAARRHLRVP